MDRSIDLAVQHIVDDIFEICSDIYSGLRLELNLDILLLGYIVKWAATVRLRYENDAS